jgi:valyl-tRNA synthetase
MPFVTEELYQRLPRRPAHLASGDCTSIMIASWPADTSEWDNEKAAAHYETLNRIIHASRSVSSDYGIKSRATLYIEISKPDLADLVRSQTHILTAMIRPCETMKVLGQGESVPVGCALYNVNEDVNVHLLVRVNWFYAALIDVFIYKD